MSLTATAMATKWDDDEDSVTHSEDRLTQNLDGTYRIDKTTSDKSSITVLVAGKTGAGKSTLINSTFNVKMAEENDDVVGTQMNDYIKIYHQLITLSNPDDYSTKSKHIDLYLMDTRGSGDISLSEKQKVERLAMLAKVKAHLIFVCIKFTERIDESTINGVKELENIFKQKFWKHAIILFTFSDQFEKNLRDKKKAPDEIKQEVSKRVDKYMTQIRKHLKFMPKENDNIPHLNVGHIDEASGKLTKLSTSDNWKQDLLELCILRCPPEKVELMMTLKIILISVTGSMAGGGIAAAGIGAGIGALIGTAVLAPGFGTLVGAGIGAGLGGPLGTVAGGVVASIGVNKYKQKKPKKASVIEVKHQHVNVVEDDCNHSEDENDLYTDQISDIEEDKSN